MSVTVFPRPNPMPYYSVSCAPCGSQPAAAACGPGATNVCPPNAQFPASPATGSLLERTGPVMKTTLANGTQAYVMQKPGVRKCALSLTIASRALPPGVDDLLTLSLLGGSMATKRQLEALGEQGVNIGAYKDRCYFTMYGQAPAGQELVLANAMLGLLKQPVQDPAVFNTLKSNLIQGTQQKAADPDDMLDNAIARRLYGPQHPNSRTPRQYAADIANQTLPGVMAYHQSLLKLLGQGNAMMVSPLPAEAQRQMLIAAFGGMDGVSPSASLNTPPDNPTLGRHRNVLLPNESVKRALIKVSWQVPDANDPDYAAYYLLRSILGEVGKNSFFDALRTNHGLVYAIDYDTTGYQLPQGRTFTPSIKVEFPKIGQAIDDIKNVTQGLCQTEISPAQLQSVQKEQLLRLREAAETADETGRLYQPWLRRPGAQPPNLQTMQAAINRVTPADIKRVANRIFNNPNGLQLLGVSAPTAVLQQWFPGHPLEKVPAESP